MKIDAVWSGAEGLAHSVAATWTGPIVWSVGEYQSAIENAWDGRFKDVLLAFVGILIFVRIVEWIIRTARVPSCVARRWARSLVEDLSRRFEVLRILEIDAHLKAREELASNDIDEALWSNACTKAGGDFDKQRAEYIKLRMDQLTRDVEY
jgi:hypothetical protein